MTHNIASCVESSRQSVSQLSVCVFLTRLSDVLRPKGDSSLKWARLDIVRGPGERGKGGREGALGLL
jgi:hypothetical protein